MAEKRQRRPLVDCLFCDRRLSKKPEVLRIAAATGQHRRWVAMTLMEFWAWVEDKGAGGLLMHYDFAMLALTIEDTDLAFWEAVEAVGWLRKTECGLVVPNFDRFNGREARRRFLDAGRKAHIRNNPRSSSDTMRTQCGQDADPSPPSPLPSLLPLKEEERFPHTPSKEEENNPLFSSLSSSPTPTRDPVAEKGDEKEKPKEEAPIPPSLGTPGFLAAWQDWQRHRSEKRQTLTPTARKQQLKRLAAMGPARAVAAIEYSIANGWTGVFEPKENPNGPGERLGRVAPTPGKYAGRARVIDVDAPAPPEPRAEAPLFAEQGPDPGGDPGPAA
jgi:hypothetical protein